MYNVRFQVNPAETRRSSTYHSDVSSNKTVKMSEVVLTMIIKWVKIFKNGPSKICGRDFKKFEKTSNFFKGSLPQILLGQFLNTVT